MWDTLKIPLDEFLSNPVGLPSLILVFAAWIVAFGTWRVMNKIDKIRLDQLKDKDKEIERIAQERDRYANVIMEGKLLSSEDKKYTSVEPVDKKPDINEEDKNKSSKMK